MCVRSVTDVIHFSKSGRNSFESEPNISVPEGNVNDDSETRMLIQEEVDEQKWSYLASLSKQLEDLTGLIQGTTTAQDLNTNPSAGASLT